jgi:hypothetical protein
MRALFKLLAILLLLAVSVRAQAPFTPQYPTAPNTPMTLGEAKDNARTILTASMSPSATTMTVKSTAAFPATGALMINNSEVVFYTGKTATTFTGLVRGREGTSAINQPINAAVEGRILAAFHNTLSLAIRNLEAKVGDGAANATPSANRYLRTDADGKSYWAPVSETGAGQFAITGYVLDFNPAFPQHVNHGLFWPPGVALGTAFFWEAWVAPRATAGALITEGTGASHALQLGFTGGSGSTYAILTGNVWDGTSSTTFGSDDGLAVGEWGHVAVGWDGTRIVTYVNGVPSGYATFAGPRKAQFGQLLVGGASSGNYDGRLAEVRGFEGINPLVGLTGGVFGGFRPSVSFLPQYISGAGVAVYAAFCASYTLPGRIIPDLSPTGYNGGTHAGSLRGAQVGTPSSFSETASSYPVPSWVFDAGAPQSFYASAPPVPASLALTPPATPGGALIFDSFSRANATYAYTPTPALGSTEAGSLGPLAWALSNVGGLGASGDFGILNGRAAYLGASPGMAVVDAGTATVDVRVDSRPGTFGNGRTGLVFRYVDSNNFWALMAEGSTPGTQTITLYRCDSGTLNTITSGAAPASWTTLRVTASGTTITAFCDATQVLTTSSATHQTATKVGMFLYQGTGPGLSRWDNFTVL